MRTYLLKVYLTKKSKKHFITDLVETNKTNHDEISELIINKKYHFDSDKKKLLGVCKKAEVIREI